MLEQMPVSDKHKMWIEEISKMFGGLVLCEISFLVDRNGVEYLHSFKDSSFPLIGDSQEEDRKNIVDIVSSKMQVSSIFILFLECRFHYKLIFY